MAESSSRLHAEQCVLSCMLLEDSAMDDVAEVLRPEHFCDSIHQLMYATFGQMQKTGKPVDLVTLADKLSELNQLSKTGGVAYLMKILETVSNPADAKYYAEVVRDRSTPR